MHPHRSEQTLSFACSDCGRRAPAEMDCSCGAGPLVDLGKPEFREMFVEIEDRRAEEHGQRLLWAAVGVGVATGVFVLATVPEIILAIPLPVPFANPLKFLLLMIGVALLASKVLGQVVPSKRRFPELVAARGQVALPSRLRAPKQGTLLALAGFVALGVLVAILVLIGRAYIAEEQVEHRKVLAKRVDKLRDCVEEHRDGDDFSSCRRDLTALYEAVDGRGDDMPLRLALEENLRCAEGCKPAALREHWSAVQSAAFGMGLLSDPELGSPRLARRPRGLAPVDAPAGADWMDRQDRD